MRAASRRTRSARRDTSSRLPMGVATTYSRPTVISLPITRISENYRPAVDLRLESDVYSLNKQGVGAMNTLEAARRSDVAAAARTMRHAHGFDDGAIVPRAFTVNPQLTHL